MRPLSVVRQFAYNAAVIAACTSRPRLDHSLSLSLSSPRVEVSSLSIARGCGGKEAQLQLLLLLLHAQRPFSALSISHSPTHGNFPFVGIDDTVQTKLSTCIIEDEVVKNFQP